MTAIASFVVLPTPALPGPAAGVVMAHQGGWDEILVVLAPIAIFGLLLWLANRRAAKEAADTDEGGDHGANDAPPGHEGP